MELCLNPSNLRQVKQHIDGRPFWPACIGHCFGLNSRATAVCGASASRKRALRVPAPPCWSPPEMQLLALGAAATRS